jgi:hypothetical protein
MSYDIRIAADERYSKAESLEVVASIISALPGATKNGSRGFLLAQEGVIHIEIDLEFATEEGDTIEGSDTINCISLHVPYSYLGGHPVTQSGVAKLEHYCFPSARLIAQHLGWHATDLQKDCVL